MSQIGQCAIQKTHQEHTNKHETIFGMVIDAPAMEEKSDAAVLPVSYLKTILHNLATVHDECLRLNNRGAVILNYFLK